MLLPLNKDEKILVTGPTANSMKYLNGGWSYNWQEKTQIPMQRTSLLF
jgi:hypothetical protein